MTPVEPGALHAGLFAVRPQVLILCATVAAGTYLMRAVPLLAAMHKRAARTTGSGSSGADWPAFLPLVAPALLAALLVASLLSQARGGAASSAAAAEALAAHVLRSLLALLGAAAAAVRLRNIGVTVGVGIAAYGLLGAVWRAFGLPG